MRLLRRIGPSERPSRAGIFVVIASTALALIFAYGLWTQAETRDENFSPEGQTFLILSKEGSSIGQGFHRKTFLSWRSSLEDIFFARRPEQPAQYKTYPGAKMIKLPKPKYQGITLEKAIAKRRSVRNYSKKSLTLEQLSELLFAACGISGKMYDAHLRTAPSAGALYPFEIYLIVNNVNELSPGIYHYAVLQHALELVKSGDFRRQIVRAALEQDMVGEAGVTFVLSAIFDRITHKYGERGFRYVYMEAGHIAQNIYLEAASLGLGSVSIGAFFDKKVNNLIGVDGRKEAAIYLQAVGAL